MEAAPQFSFLLSGLFAFKLACSLSRFQFPFGTLPLKDMIYSLLNESHNSQSIDFLSKVIFHPPYGEIPYSLGEKFCIYIHKLSGSRLDYPVAIHRLYIMYIMPEKFQKGRLFFYISIQRSLRYFKSR